MMLAEEKNVAYDLSLFEEKHNKTNNVVKLQKRYNSSEKTKSANIFGILFLMFVSAAVMAMMLYSQVQLTELTEQSNAIAKKLNENKSIYTQLQMRAETKYSLKSVEEYAMKNMDMKKADAGQIEYISLCDGDKAEINQGFQKDGMVTKAINSILGLLS